MPKKRVVRPSAGQVAMQVRERLLTMEDGEYLGSQEELLAEYQINIPTLRQAMAAVMNEQLVTSRRGVGGGFFARRPDAQVVTHIVALYLRSRGVTLAEQVATLLPVRIEIARRAARSRDEAAREELVEFLENDKRTSATTDFQLFNAAERQFNRLLARMCGSITLTLFLEILFDLSSMVHHENDVFGTKMERRIKYRQARNLIAQSVLDHDEVAAMQHAGECSKLTWAWLREAHPELMGSDFDADFSGSRMFGRTAMVHANGNPCGIELGDLDMAVSGKSAVDALRKLEEQQRELEQRKNTLEQTVASELGRAVIKGGGLSLELDQIQQIMERVTALGLKEAMRRLDRNQ